MPKKKAGTPLSSRPQAQGYGFPKGKKGLLTWSWAEQRLKKSHNYWITTVKPDGSPHAMVVWGLWQDGRFLFSTGSQSRKTRNLAQNARCIVCTEDAHEAVIVEGIAEIADVEARRKLIPDLPAQVRLGLVQHARRPALDERARLCRPSQSRVRSLGKILPNQIHPLAI